MLSKKRLVLGLVILLCCSCKNDTLLQETSSIDKSGWPTDSAYTFYVDVKDTRQPYDIALMLRHSGRYAFQNVWFFIDSTDPYQKNCRDTIEVILADNRGRWFGSGLGSLYQLDYPFKQNYTFPHAGTYSFRIEQGMRYNPLEGITDIGVKITKHTNN